MRTRLPLVLMLAALVCCVVMGSPQTTTSKRKPATKKRVRKPVQPTITAAMRAVAAEKVDQYLMGSGDGAIQQPGALVPFFERLLRSSGENAEPVHIIHYGDSHTAADDWTGGLRDLLKERFGDGGAGFSLVGHPFPGYRRFDARGGGTTLWHTVGGRAGIGDGWFGLGGVGMEANRAGQSVYLDAQCDRLEIHYLKQPGGGRLALYDYDQPIETIETAGEWSPGVSAYTSGAGEHRYLLKTLDSRPVRLFGWVADKSTGVTYEALGLNGAEAGVILKWNEDMLAGYLQRRNPGLIVLAYGTNEAGDPYWEQESYREMYAKLIGRIRAMAPAASILAIGPDDRWSSTGGRWHPYPGIEHIVEDQAAVCKSLRVAYWDLRARMGGSGSMRDWVYGGFAQGDYVHFTSMGYRRLSAVLFGDLMQQFEAYKKARLTTDQSPHERAN